MFKIITYFIIYILSIILFIPTSVVFFGEKIGFYKVNQIKEEKSIEENIKEEDIINDLEIIRNNEKEDFLENNLEEYIVGVVAAEIPISFEKEALKAQAIAARTYAYKRIGNTKETIDHKNIGQAYNSIDEMKKKWGKNFDLNYRKVKESVYETKGTIMLYNDEPIDAVFHSTSAGVTEVSENIWGKNLPYIKSVDSKVDENAPNFIYTTKVSKDKLVSEISKKFPKIDKNKIIDSFNITKRSSADYVLEVEILGNKLTGRDIRTMFGLRSTNFTIKKSKDGIEFTTKGYGHGAGMSQYGANFMAKDGKSYIEILNHYYVGVSLDKVY